MSDTRHGWADTQDAANLEMVVERARSVDLTWVEQVLDLLEEAGTSPGESVNDIGCNVGHFFKGMSRRGLDLDYCGFDIDELYLAKAQELFPALRGRVHRLDITKEAPPEADIVVSSATLEHVPDALLALDRAVGSARRLAVVRAFMGDHPLRSLQVAAPGSTPYPVTQFSFQEVFDTFARHGLWPRLVRDRHTDSLPIYMRNGIVRTYYLAVGQR